MTPVLDELTRRGFAKYDGGPVAGIVSHRNYPGGGEMVLIGSFTEEPVDREHPPETHGVRIVRAEDDGRDATVRALVAEAIQEWMRGCKSSSLSWPRLPEGCA